MFLSESQLAKFYVILSGILFSVIGYLGLKIFESGADVEVMLFWRFIISSLFLVIYFKKLPNFKEAYISFLLGVMLYAPSTYLWFYSIKSISTSLSMVVFYSFPIYVAILSAIINKESFTPLKLLSFFIMIIGLVLIADLKNFNIDYLGLSFTILSAIIYGLYFFLSKRLSKDIGADQASIMVCLGNSLVFFILSIKSFDMNFHFEFSLYFHILLIAIFATALPILFLFKGVKYISEVEAAILSVFEPVFSLIIGVYLLNESINLAQIIGIIFITLSSITIQFRSNKV